MTTETVNGRLRQVFDFSKPGATIKFYAPVSLGAGYRARIDMAKGIAIMDSPVVKGLVADYFEKHPAPKGMPFQTWYNSKIDDLYPILLNAFEMREAWRSQCEVLNVILEPAPDSITVEQWYLEFATDEEVERVLNFIEPKSESKTATAPTLIGSGEDTIAAEKDEPSKATSRRRSKALPF